MITWCRENLQEDPQNLCDSVQDAIISDSPNLTQYSWITKTSNIPNGDQAIINMKPWDLAQYLAIYDFLYVSRILGEVSLNDILSPIARDDMSILSSPDLRADQVLSPLTIERY